MKFTEEQIKEIKNIDNIDDLLKLFKRLIYLSNISYKDFTRNLKSKIEYMLDDMFQ